MTHINLVILFLVLTLITIPIFIPHYYYNNNKYNKLEGRERKDVEKWIELNFLFIKMR